MVPTNELAVDNQLECLACLQVMPLSAFGVRLAGGILSSQCDAWKQDKGLRRGTDQTISAWRKGTNTGYLHLLHGHAKLPLRCQFKPCLYPHRLILPAHLKTNDAGAQGIFVRRMHPTCYTTWKGRDKKGRTTALTEKHGNRCSVPECRKKINVSRYQETRGLKCDECFLKKLRKKLDERKQELIEARASEHLFPCRYDTL